MKTSTYICCFLQVTFITSFSITQRRLHLSKRQDDEDKTSTSQIGCVDMKSEAGEFYFRSDGSDMICGLYLIAMPDELIQLDFHSFKVDCQQGGLLAIVDGWEAQGQFFPSEFDTSISMDERYRTYCGQSVPIHTFISSQNVALVQFRIPTVGHGFRVSVKFLKNMQPCNVVSMMEQGTVTIQNFGHRNNCSVSILYPEKIEVISMDVAHSSHYPYMNSLTSNLIYDKMSLSSQCEPHAEDFVEILDGNGMDPSYMWQEATLCGVRPRKARFYLGCQHSVVRLVSSGKFYNSVTFRHRQLNDIEQQILADIQC